MAKTKQVRLHGVSFPKQLNDALEMKEKQQPQHATAEQSSTLRERALLVRFSIGRWYGSGADEEIVGEIRAAKGATGEIGSFTKRLMKRQHLLEINQVTAESRRYHKQITMPWGDSGARILNVEAFREYKERMTTFESQFFAAVERFMQKYDQLVIAEKQNLQGLWRASDYPSAEEMRANFRYGLSVDVLPDVHDLRLHLSKEQAEEIRADIEQRTQLMMSEALHDVYERLRGEIADAKEKLDDPDKRLQTKMFGALQGIVALLPKLNITADPKLTALGREIQKELSATNVESLRDDTTARKQASAKAANLLDKIAALKKG